MGVPFQSGQGFPGQQNINAVPCFGDYQRGGAGHQPGSATTALGNAKKDLVNILRLCIDLGLQVFPETAGAAVQAGRKVDAGDIRGTAFQ